MINIPELRAIVNDLLTRIEREVGPNVPIDTDFYWDLPSPEMWNMSAKITEVNEVGRLTDDLHFLRAMESALEQGPILNLIHAAPLLRYLGEKVAV
jgi:hypothetical protein